MEGAQLPQYQQQQPLNYSSSVNTSAGSINKRKLYVSSLDFKAEEQDIRDKFGRYGAIISVKIPRDQANPTKAKGFAFVEFENESDADKARAELNESQLLSRKILVSVSDTLVVLTQPD